MEKKFTRRSILNMGAVAGGIAASGAVLGAASMKSAPKPPTALPWAWKTMDPDGVQERAYQSAWSKIACMYGTFDGVLGTLADKYGAPYNTFPIGATLYGSGGIAGLGSLCGTINACGLLFSLFTRNQEDLFALCREISLWYERTKLPLYKPANPKVDMPMVMSAAGSNLCHVSSTIWSNASGHKLLTNQHFERCNRLAADVARQAVAMLNEYSVGKLKLNEKMNTFSDGCLSCHGPGKTVANVASEMTCDTCHNNPH